MKSKTLHRLRSAVAVLTVASAAIGSFVFSSPASALTPAGTSITNSATVTYTDQYSNSLTATSNQVSVSISAVYGFVLADGGVTSAATTAGATLTAGARQAGANQTIYQAYTIDTSNANASDSYTITVKQPSSYMVSSIDVFPDATGQGLPSGTTSLLSGGAVGNTASASGSTSAISVGGGTTYSFVVAYTMPATLGAASTPTVLVSSASGGTAYKVTATDNLTITAQAVFSVTGAFVAPTVNSAGQGNTNNWGSGNSSGIAGTTTTVYTISYTNNGGAAAPLYLKGYLPVNWYTASTAIWSGAPGMSGGSTPTNGGALSDAGAGNGNPTGIDYKVTSGVFEAVIVSVAPGTSGTLSFMMKVPSGTAPGVVSGGFGAFFSGATSATTCSSSETTIAAAIVAGKCGALATTGMSYLTNLSKFTVLATYATPTISKVTPSTGIYANGFPGIDSDFVVKITNNSTVADTFVLSNTSAAIGGTTAISTAYAGTAQTAQQFPTGTVFNWWAADANNKPAYQLSSSIGGTAPDTGPIAASGTFNAVLVATLPAVGSAPSKTVVFNGQNLSVNVGATSVGDTSKVVGTTFSITNVKIAIVDMQALITPTTAAGGYGTGVSNPAQIVAAYTSAAGTFAVTPGKSQYNLEKAPDTDTAITAGTNNSSSLAGNAVFDLYITNNDSASATFNLSASQTTSFPGNLPAGWSVAFYDAASSTVSYNAAPTGSTLTSITVTAGGVKHIYAVVTVSGQATPGVFDIYFNAISQAGSGYTGGLIYDFMHNQLQVLALVGSATSMTVTPGQSLQGAAGVSVNFYHAVQNTGSGSCGATSGYISVVPPTVPSSPTGWSVALYNDGSTAGVFDSNTTLMNVSDGSGGYKLGGGGALAATTSNGFFVRVFSPASLTQGTVQSFTTVVKDPDTGNPCGVFSLVDTLTVVDGIQVNKYQVSDTACTAAFATTAITSSAPISVASGKCIQYKVVATNVSATPVKNVSLVDMVPAYTTANTTQPTTICTSTGMYNNSGVSTTATYYQSSGTALNTGAAARTVFSCNVGGATPANTLNPGGTITLMYDVKVN